MYPPHAMSRRPLLTSCLLGIFLTPYLGASVNVALPAVGRELGMGPVGLNAVTSAYLLAAVMALVPIGNLADRIGRKRVFTCGIGAVAAAAIACALAPSGGWLLGARFVQGLGSALIFATGAARLVAAYPPQERGRIMGYTAAVVYLGLAIGPVAGGLLTGCFGWRVAVASVVPLCLVAAVLELANPAEPLERSSEHPFDLVGTLLYIPGILGLVAAALLIPSSYALWPALTGAALLVALVARALHHPAPVLDVRLWRGNRVFAFSNLAALINYGATFAVGFLLSLYLQYNCGLPAQIAGVVLITQPLLMALLSPFAGRLSDRHSPRLLASAGMALTASGLGLLLFLPEDGSLPLATSALAVIGVGIALFSSPNTNAVLGAVERPALGAASAMLSTMRLLGQMLSMAIVLAVFRIWLDAEPVSVQHHAGFAASLRVCAMLFAVLCAFGVMLSLARGRRAA